MNSLKKHIALLFLFFTSVLTYGQEYDWVKFYQGKHTQAPAGMQVDNAGNQYATFNNTSVITIDSQQVDASILILKQDSSGSVKWYKTVSSLSGSSGRVKILGSGFTSDGRHVSVIASIDRGIIIGSDTILGEVPNFKHNLFVVELDTSGNLTYGSKLLYGKLYNLDWTADLTGHKITVDRNNNLVLSLRFIDSLYAFDKSGSHLYADQSRLVCRIIKFSSAGRQLEWVTTMPSRTSFTVSDLDVDIRGNIYTSTFMTYSPSTDSSFFKAAGFDLPSTAISLSGAVFVYDKDGNGKNWFFLRSSHSMLSIQNIVAHDSDGIFLSGFGRGDTIVTGSYRYLLPDNKAYHFYCRTDSRGNMAWFKHEDTSYAYSLSAYSYYGSMTNYADEFIYLSYHTTYNSNQTLIYDGQRFPVPSGVNQAWGMTMKIDHLGNILWGLRTADGPFKGMGTDASSSFYFQGFWIKDSIAFGRHKAYSTTGRDAFIGKTSDYAIFRGEITPGPYCAGDTLKIPYTKIGSYLDSNEFIAQLSDEYGNFTGGERELGRISSTSGDTIAGILPLFDVVSSGQYRIRIVSTKPQVQSFYRLDTLDFLIYSRDSANPGDPEYICPNDTLMLSTTGGTQWRWSPAEFMNDSSLRQPLVWPDSTTVYTIIIADSSGCGQPDTAFKVVYVRDNPRLTPAFSDTTICPSDTIDLNVTAFGGDSLTYSIVWYKDSISPQGLIRSGSLPINSDSISVFGDSLDTLGSTYFALLSDSCGNYTDTIEITVRTYDDLKTSIAPSDTLLCRSDSISITPLVTGGRSSAYTYDWFDQSGSLNIFSDKILINAQYGDSGQIYVIVNDGCKSHRDTAEFHFKFYSPLEPDIFHLNTALDDTSLCVGDTIHVYSGINPALSNALNYTWLVNGSPISSSDKLIVNADSLRRILGVHPDSTFSTHLFLNISSSCETTFDSVRIRLLPVPGSAVQTPTVSVIDANTITVYFDLLPRPNISEYRLYKILSTGRLLIDSISPGATPKLFSINDPLNTSDVNCYQIATIDSCGNISFSDTVCSQKLGGEGDQLSNKLTWSLDNGLIPDKIWIWNGIEWDSIGLLTSTDTNFSHPDLQCKRPYTYRLSFTRGSGVRFYSNAITLQPFDTIPPSPPSRLDVSVNIDQSIQLFWTTSIDTDVEYYEVWRDTGTGFKRITTVTDTQFSDIKISRNSPPYRYFIIAVDSCNNGNRGISSDTVISVRTNSYTGGCVPFVRLQWAKYNGFKNDVSTQRILRSIDGINYTQIDSVGSNTLTYIDSTVAKNVSYIYRLEIFSSVHDQSVFSDTTHSTPFIFPHPNKPELNHVSVSATGINGENTIVWNPADASDTLLRGYYIWEHTNGVRTLIYNESDLSSTKFTHQNTNTVTVNHYYSVSVYDVCLADTGTLSRESDMSDIHKTVLLEITSQNLENQLDWSTYIGFQVGQYTVERSDNGGPMIAAAVLNSSDSTWTDTSLFCGHRYVYRISAREAGGPRISFSNEVSAVAFDTIGPNSIRVINASVQKTGAVDGEVDLIIESSDDKNAHQILLYRIDDGGAAVLINSLQHPASGTLNYTDEKLNTSGATHRYYAVAIDSCGNMGLVQDSFDVILLQSTPMNNGIRLDWTAHRGYDQWEYRLQRLDATNTWNTIAELASNEHTYIDSMVICSDVYTYRVLCAHDAGTVFSLSNEISDSPIDTIAPRAPMLLNITVTDPNKEAMLEWRASEERDVAGYVIHNVETGIETILDDPSEYQYVVPINGLSQRCFTIRSYDSCGNHGDTSEPICLILPDITALEGFNSIAWNQHEFGGEMNVNHYEIYVSYDTVNWTLVTQTPPGQTDFLHTDLDIDHEDFIYQIRATSDSSVPYISNSLVLAVHQKPTLWIPSSFSPYISPGLNDVFGPKGSKVRSYTIKMWDRWGGLVYESQNSIPWDGQINGERTSGNIFLYQMSITDSKGRISHHSGTVTLVH